MEYNRIVAVTGLPGLYEIVSSKNDGALVRSVEDKTTRFISSRIHNLSHLESIEIYTTGENVNLTEVFNAMKSSGTALPDVKDNKQLKGYFEQVFPALDFERVYNSDMKKMVKWYESLNANGIDFTASAAEATDESAEDATASAGETAPVGESDTATDEKPKKAAPKASADAQPDSTEAKPRKKAAPKAEAEGATDLFGDAAVEEKPKKKAAPKKKKDDTAE